MWQIVGGSWRTVATALPVVGVVAAIQAVLGLASLPFAGGVDPNQLSAGDVALGLLLVLINFFLFPLIQAGYLAVAQARASGTAGSPLASFRDGIRQLYLRLLGFETLITVVVMGGGVLAGVVSVLAADGLARLGGPWDLVIVLVCLLPVALVVYLLMLIGGMSPVAMCVERLPVFAAIRRGLSIGRASIGTLMGANLILLLTLAPAFLVLGILAGLQLTPAGGGMTWLVVGVVLQAAVTAASTLLFVAAWMAVFRRRTAAGFSPTA